MAEQKTTFLGKVMNSVGGMLIGFVMIPASFFVVGYSALRTQPSIVLKDAAGIEQAASAKDERAVFATGQIQAEQIGDAPYIRPGHYIELRRSPQIYAWKHVEAKKNDKDEVTEPARCEKEWTSSPDMSVGSKEGCRGKYNSKPSIDSAEHKTAIKLLAGGTSYAVNESVSYYGMDGVSFTEAQLAGPYTAKGDEVYLNSSCASSPDIGCERLQYSGTAYDPNGQYTVVGTPDGTQFQEFKGYLAVGKGDYKATMESITTADSAMTIGLFVASVLLFGGGLSLIVGPLLSLIEYIPFVGKFGANAIRVIFFIFAFVTMGLVFVFLRFWYVILALVVILIIVAVVMAKRRKAAAPAAS